MELGQRQISLRSLVTGQAFFQHCTDDSHHGNPFVIGGHIINGKTLAHCIRAGPKHFRHALVDDSHEWLVRSVGRIKVASHQERNSHRPQVVLGDHLQLDYPITRRHVARQ